MATPEELTGVAWHISTFSENGGMQCVEAGPLTDGTERVAVRHSQRPRRRNHPLHPTRMGSLHPRRPGRRVRLLRRDMRVHV